MLSQAFSAAACRSRSSFCPPAPIRPRRTPAFGRRHGIQTVLPGKAIAKLDLRLAPDMTAAFNNRGNAYIHLGEYDLAIEDNRGRAYYALGKYDLAIEDLNKSIRLKPNYPYLCVSTPTPEKCCRSSVCMVRRSVASEKRSMANADDCPFVPRLPLLVESISSDDDHIRAIIRP